MEEAGLPWVICSNGLIIGSDFRQLWEPGDKAVEAAAAGSVVEPEVTIGHLDQQLGRRPETWRASGDDGRSCAPGH